MTDDTQPEAREFTMSQYASKDDMIGAMRKRIAELESELEAVGAGGVSGPLMGIAAPPTAQAEGWTKLPGQLPEPGMPAGWKAVPVNPTPEMWKAAKTVPDPNPPYPPHYGLVWDAMLAASPTPPAEQQAQLGAVYAELGCDEVSRVVDVVVERCISLTQDATGIKVVYDPIILGDALLTELRDFADRTHALRMQAAPKAAPEVGNSGFDHKTAADLLNNKTVSDKAVRKFVATSRWAHDEKAALSAMLLSVRGVLASREAEIALLKKALLEAEAAPKQEAQEPCGWTTGITWRPNTRLQSEQVIKITRDTQPKYGYTTPIYTAPQPAPLSECLRLLNSFEYDGDEDSQAKAFFKAHINEDWFFHVKNSLELALAAQGGKA